jgi:hypothetical protein
MKIHIDYLEGKVEEFEKKDDIIKNKILRLEKKLALEEKQHKEDLVEHEETLSKLRKENAKLTF